MSDKPDDEARRDAHPLRRVTLRNFDSLIDQQMREAEAAGQFKDLPGSGKPLEELRIGFRMLKGAGYAPPWIELQKSIRDEQADLQRWLVRANERWPRLGELERGQLRAEYEQKLRDLNKQISGYNLTAPPAAGQLPLLQPWRELRKLGQ
jgi:DnaJ family protein C protein 28